ncbi:hypothetical protein NQK81_27755 [Amycolatopsis roodepoortensis]|uniref:M50 family metallopeptidase n=1 Tax=Amycolatopsis roodepoortensis TaxID=700274 RepID=UPI00214AF3BB|nr:M50 family metallopeptidase [Amycolatopsis roodepoortensis]UUV28572.1 hypothetical protein NQK81_27755 [Amycolatopsis roodepoortensis]
MTAPGTESPDMDEDRVTAWHEAGHAVVYLLQGRSLRYVTLRPRGAGRVGFTAVRPRRVDLGAQAVVAHAGPLAQARYVLEATSAAERRHDGVTAEDVRLGAYLLGGHDDLALISEARQAYGVSDRQPDLWAEFAQDIVDRHWNDIGRIAEALLEHRTLTGAQLRAWVPGLALGR